MEKQSEAVVINMENIEGPHYEDPVEESSTPRNNQDIQEETPKTPKVPEKNEGPAPISNNNEGPPALPLDHDEELDFMLKKDESSTSTRSQQPKGHKIAKVPNMLRDVDKNICCFDPRAVSIGPYHHGKHGLRRFERRKTKWAWKYCRTREGVVDLYNRVKKVASAATKFYDMKTLKRLKGIDHKAFTKMMFLDGCFILEFIMWFLGGKEYYDIGMNNNDIANVKRDLFLLENQLPYIVLEALMEGNKEWKEKIENFITLCRRLPPAVKSWMSGASNYFFWSPSEPKFQSPLHLLDLTRTRYVKQSATSALLDVVSHCLGIRSSPKKTATSDWYSYHSARELKSMGICFRPNKAGSFGDVKFKSQLFIKRVLTLPPILIDASTESLLLNMLAFESSCTNLEYKRGVASYLCFMDSLIDHADDVMILRSENVIINCLGTDQDVADLFNNIASDLVPNPHIYAEAKRGIQKYCNNKFKQWMAECANTYFRSPWTLLALCGAIFVIVLTAAQTYMAAWPLKN